MALEMIKRYITSIIYSVILLGLLGVPLSVGCAAGVDTGGAHQDIGATQDGGQENRSQHIGFNQSEDINRY